MRCPDAYVFKSAQRKESPCKSCWRGEDGETCECKTCPVWRAWWLARWDLIHKYGQQQQK